MTFLSVCCTNIRTNPTYYVQHTTDWTELNVLLYDGTRVLTGLLLCVWLCLTTFNKRIWWWWWWWSDIMQVKRTGIRCRCMLKQLMLIGRQLNQRRNNAPLSTANDHYPLTGLS